ncbi:MAG: hypothetical protein K9K38_00845 [Rhodoferax sp.]|nr:hypothetical protein [Rhodoferax sp.]
MTPFKANKVSFHAELPTKVSGQLGNLGSSTTTIRTPLASQSRSWPKRQRWTASLSIPPAQGGAGKSTPSTLFAPPAVTKMKQGDPVRAVYLHACQRYVEREFMTNTTLRERVGIEPKNSATGVQVKRRIIVVQVRCIDGKLSGLADRGYVRGNGLMPLRWVVPEFHGWNPKI